MFLGKESGEIKVETIINTFEGKDEILVECSEISLKMGFKTGLMSIHCRPPPLKSFKPEYRTKTNS